MKDDRLKMPIVVIAIGLILSIIVCLITCISKQPTTTEQDFEYAATYRLNGETKNLEGTYRCRFLFPEGITASIERDYEGFFLADSSESVTGTHTIAQQDNLELRIVFHFVANYLMGDGERGEVYSEVIPDPYLAVYDKEGYEYHDPQMLANFDAELLSWKTPQPIENAFVFSGFSLLHAGSMLAILVVGLLTIIAIMVVVKKEIIAPYSQLDRISVILSFLVCFLGIPFFTISALLLELVMSGDAFIYQVYMCIPAITALTVATSVGLRRKGFTKIGLFIQLIGPVLFFVPVALEPIFYSIFE